MFQEVPAFVFKLEFHHLARVVVEAQQGLAVRKAGLHVRDDESEPVRQQAKEKQHAGLVHGTESKGHGHQRHSIDLPGSHD